MESHKNKVLRIMNNVYNISKHKLVSITFLDSTEDTVFKCQDKCGVNLFNVVTNKPLYEIGFDTLDKLRDRIACDFMIGLITNIHF